MRTRTRHVLVSSASGVVVGAVIVFVLLVALGSRAPILPSATPGTVSSSYSPTASATAAHSSTAPPAGVQESPPPRATSPRSTATTSRSEETVRNTEGGYTVRLPSRYRIADEITAFERAQVPASATLTVTQGSPTEERAYLDLIRQLRGDQTATEAPSFLPGRTMTIVRVAGGTMEESDAQLSRGKEVFTTEAGLPAVRYRRVEGLFTYDATYVTLPSTQRVAVNMTYASEEPLFDERAYSALVHSLKPL